MNSILLLTANISTENEFYCNLIHLGHDVFCTRQVFLDLSDSKLAAVEIQRFKQIIISETISNMSMNNILTALFDIHYSGKVYRKMENSEYESTIPQNDNSVEIEDFILCSFSIEEIRETLAADIKYIQEETPKKTLNQSIKYIKFSSLEKKLLFILINAKGTPIHRSELALLLWENKLTSSAGTHLSTLVKKINKKVLDATGEIKFVETMWKKGYLINPENAVYNFFEQMTKEQANH